MKDERIVIDVAMPRGWNDMSQEQLRFFFIMIDDCDSMQQVMTRCFLRWGNIEVIGRTPKSNDYILRKGKTYFSVSPLDLCIWMRPICWMEMPPSKPVVLEKYGHRHKAIDPLFKGVPFGQYLACIANWSDIMDSGTLDYKSMSDLCNILYGFRPKRIRKEFVGCIVYWMSAIQDYFSGRFKDLFAPASSDGQGSLGSSSRSLQDSVNAMIRALTKGDVLKEKAVLETDTWRALTELDAQAGETRQIKDSMKKK